MATLHILEGNSFRIVDDATGFVFVDQPFDPRTGIAFVDAETAETYAEENFSSFLPQTPAE
jgi:hypothetical protein